MSGHYASLILDASQRTGGPYDNQFVCFRDSICFYPLWFIQHVFTIQEKLLLVICPFNNDHKVISQKHALNIGPNMH